MLITSQCFTAGTQNVARPVSKAEGPDPAFLVYTF